MKIKHDHVGLSVADAEAAVAFYCDNFGLRKLSPIFPFEGEIFSSVMGLEGATGRMCMVGNDQFRLELFEYANPVPTPRDPNYPVSDHGYSHFGIEVEDIEKVFEDLAQAGVRWHCPVTTYPSGMKAAYGRDPWGNVFEILEMGPPPAG